MQYGAATTCNEDSSVWGRFGRHKGGVADLTGATTFPHIHVEHLIGTVTLSGQRLQHVVTMRALLLLLVARFASATPVPEKNAITVELTTSDCLYADTTEPIFIQFFVSEDRVIVEKSERFSLTQRGTHMKRGETRVFHIHRPSNYCKEKKLCSNMSFVGIYLGVRSKENLEFDTWHTNNITISFNFDNNIHQYNFDYTEEGPCIRPLHFWSPEFWHRYGPGQEFEERHLEYAIGENITAPTYIF